MVSFVGLVLAAGGSFRVLAGLGWLMLVLYVFADDIRAVADRAFYGSGSRAGRAGLRRIAAYAGSEATLDVAALLPEQARDVARYMEEADRAGVAATQLEAEVDPRLVLLGRDEFAPVRAALGLSSSWAPEEGLSTADAVRRAETELKPRERQALGLKYLGYSDKEMARFMGVKAGVPRSYLSEGKRKVGLAAGPQMMLFVHFSGIAERDALPLLEGDTEMTTHPADDIAGTN